MEINDKKILVRLAAWVMLENMNDCPFSIWRYDFFTRENEKGNNLKENDDLRLYKISDYLNNSNHRPIMEVCLVCQSIFGLQSPEQFKKCPSYRFSSKELIERIKNILKHNNIDIID